MVGEQAPFHGACDAREKCNAHGHARPSPTPARYHCLPLAVCAAVGRLRHDRRVAAKRSNGLGSGLISAGQRQNAVGAGACGRQRNLHRHDRWRSGKWLVYRQCQKHVNGAGCCWRSRARDWLQPKCERSHFAARFERFSGPQQCPCVHRRCVCASCRTAPVG